ncbi:chemotaxis protein CheW [Marinobacter halodurans]|uniref:chemotaxis protein CheW n=1 Tax=Marinobacter halodurans TaxID=2528979 RepID=UPI0013F16F60|nr:chemotaxis protein CheW [Marinobacter halodurans]
MSNERSEWDWDAVKHALRRALENEAVGGEPSAESAQQELRRRARELARPWSLEDNAETLSLLPFEIEGACYALEPDYVLEAFAAEALTPIPCTPGHVAGLIVLRGRMLPVLDLHVVLGMASQTGEGRRKVIVLSDGRMEFGLQCDRVLGTYELPLAQLQTENRGHSPYIKGITTDQWAVLDAGALLGDVSLVVDRTV